MRRDTTKAMSFMGYAASTALLLCIGMSSARAVTIDFEDLAQPPCDPISCEPLQVDTQYANLGVVFGGAGLESVVDSPFARSGSNAIYDFFGPGMGISFTGTLPTEVSFYVSASAGDAIYITADGPGGTRQFTTDGWQGPNIPGAPYRDLQYVSFSGAEISSLSFGDFYNRRGIFLDDLTFSRDSASVPEPGALPLIAAGLLLLARLRRR